MSAITPDARAFNSAKTVFREKAGIVHRPTGSPADEAQYEVSEEALHNACKAHLRSLLSGMEPDARAAIAMSLGWLPHNTNEEDKIRLYGASHGVLDAIRRGSDGK